MIKLSSSGPRSFFSPAVFVSDPGNGYGNTQLTVNHNFNNPYVDIMVQYSNSGGAEGTWRYMPSLYETSGAYARGWSAAVSTLDNNSVTVAVYRYVGGGQTTRCVVTEILE